MSHHGKGEKRGCKKEKKANYFGWGCSDLHKRQTHVNFSKLQILVLYCIVDGNKRPTWLSIRHHNTVKNTVVLLDTGMARCTFNGSIELERPEEGLDDFSKPGNDTKRSMLRKRRTWSYLSEKHSESMKDSGLLVVFSVTSNGHNGSMQDGGKSRPTVGTNSKTRAESNDYIIKSPPPSLDRYLPITFSSERLPLLLKPLADAFVGV